MSLEILSKQANRVSFVFCKKALIGAEFSISTGHPMAVHVHSEVQMLLLARDSNFINQKFSSIISSNIIYINIAPDINNR